MLVDESQTIELTGREAGDSLRDEIVKRRLFWSFGGSRHARRLLQS
jgi:hypothetical protein